MMNNKQIKKVRQSIEQRKKMRGMPMEDVRQKQLLPVMRDEEKHGYLPEFPDGPFQSEQKGKMFPNLVLKGILSVMLFFGVALLSQTDISLLSKPKGWADSALTEELPFARMHLWYQNTFGTPLAFSPKQAEEASAVPAALPVSGSVSESFQENGTGVMIMPKETAGVSALEDGVVVFAGNDRETGKTVIMQHADGSKSTYGNLSSVDVHIYELVTAGSQLGGFSPDSGEETVYFSIEKDRQYVDPVQVIKVDDQD